jgi:hypothetical protein
MRTRREKVLNATPVFRECDWGKPCAISAVCKGFCWRIKGMKRERLTTIQEPKEERKP